MLSRRQPALFLERSEHYTLAARADSWDLPLTIAELREFPPSVGGSDLRAFGQVKGAFLKARVGFQPPGRFLVRASLDARRLKEAGYLTELVSAQTRLDPATLTYRMVSCQDGRRFDPQGVFQREVLICGAPTEQVLGEQQKLVGDGVLPERMELGSVSRIGGLLHYMQWRKLSGALLVVEIGASSSNLILLANGAPDVTRTLPSGFNSILPVVQKELGLKDEDSAGKLFFSNSFDFTTMGAQLLRRLARDLEAALGHYEVQTGQRVASVLVAGLAPNLKWLPRSLAASIGVGVLDIEFAPWLTAAGVRIPDNCPSLDERWFGLFSLMVNHVNQPAT